MNSEKQNLRPVFADQVNTMVNLLKPYMPSTETYENSDGGAVHPTRNSDGSISLSGETIDAGITIKAGTAYLRTDKSYCLCGTPGQGVNLQIIIDGKTYTDNGTGTTFSVRSGGYFDVNVVINPHTQIDKLTIYPIVTRNMQAKFGDFVPYISDTDQLNSQVADLSARLTKEPYIAVDAKPVQAQVYQLITSYVIPEDGIYDIISYMDVSVSSASSYNNAIFINPDDSITKYKEGTVTRSSMYGGGGSISYMIMSLKKGDSVKVFAYTAVTCNVQARLTVARRF